MLLVIFRDKPRKTLAFLICGMAVALFAGEINGLVADRSAYEMHYITANFTPIVEECLKAFPIVLLFYAERPPRQLLLECSVAVGIGFATFENICIMMSQSQLGTGFALARGLGSGIMHGVCTLAVGYAVSFIGEKQKISHIGIYAALSVAIIYHSIYNILVRSDYYYVGLILPVITLAFLDFVLIRQFRGFIEKNGSGEKGGSE